jgi:PAS domain S-box-containing protein
MESATAIRDDSGKTLYYDGTAQDITLHRRMEQELRTSEARLRVVLQSLPIAIYTAPVDPTVDAIWISGNSASVTGYTATEYLAEEDLWRRRLHPEDRDRVLAVFATATSGKEINVEYRWMVKNGTYRWFLDRSVIRAIGAGSDFIGVIVDITEQKEAEDRLRRSEERFRLISQSTVDLISVLDLEGKTVYRNPAYVKLLGKEAFIPGMDAFTHIHPDDREFIVSIFMETVSTGIGRRAEYRFVAHDGTIHTIESQGSVIRDSSGAIVNVVVVSRDITEKRLLEQQFLRMQRMESLGTLAGGVAHDLNNVLSPILLGVHMIKKSVVGEEALKLVQTLEASARRGSDIVKQILAFARGIDSEMSRLEPLQVIMDIVPIIRETFPKTITVSEDITRDVWPILGNATQLHQVIMNLCVNARDAMPGGGNLSISARNGIIDSAFSRMYPQAKPGKYVLISVEDSGTGIPQEILDNIFVPFFTTKEAGKGTGLGLSTTHSIVKAHKGFINVHSKPGEGSRFEIYLPVAGDTVVERKESATLQGHGEMLLVVDAEESILQITRQSLEAFGYRVFAASNGDDALALLSANAEAIAAAIVDSAVTDHEGKGITAGLRRINPELQIVSCRSIKDLPAGEAIREGTGEISIAKPFTARTLIRAVSTALKKEGLAATHASTILRHPAVTRAIVRPPGANFADGLTTVDLGRPEFLTALAQHEKYCRALQECSVEVIALPSDESFPDGTFVEDAAILTPKGAVLTRPGEASRLGEIESIRNILTPLFPSIFHIVAPGTLDGGDVCEAGDHFFIGISRRTNESGARQLADLLRHMGYSSTFIDIRNTPGILHLKSGIAYLGDRRIAVWGSLAKPDLFRGYELVHVPPGEEYAANCIRINDRMLIASGFPGFESGLRQMGYNVLPVDMSEFQKMDGGLSCLSLRL